MDEREREHWRQADALLDALLDRPPHARAAALAALHCSDEVRERLEGLLAADSSSGGPLDRPLAVTTGSAPGQVADLTGQLLGRWRLHREIGRGGMAVVYRGVSEGGMAGQVAAVKVLTLGTLARMGRDSVLREQDALLRLRHPHVAALYDAGVAADGTPWLATALVEGEAIDRWCQCRRLDIRARIGLVRQLCAALDYSHRNLVVHRDIKPSNVMVDDEGHVRVLDFGIARLLDADHSEATSTHCRALTPGYAAPEQFTGAPPSTSMDVYGVGALLYRLLADMPPQREADGHLVPASRALRQAAGGRPTPAQSRWIRQVAGDLDTVMAKALALRAEDRYPSIEALAEDLRRWQERLPVRARPPHWRYRLSRFVARHRWPVAAGALATLLLVVGIGGTAWQLRSMRIAEAATRSALEEARALREFGSGILARLLPSTLPDANVGQDRMFDELIARAHADFAGKPGLLSAIEVDLGNAAWALDDHARAHALFASALERRTALHGAEHPSTAEALAYLGMATRWMKHDDPAAGERLLGRAVATMRSHGAPTNMRLDALVNWQQALLDIDRFDEARAALAEAEALCGHDFTRNERCERVWLHLGYLALRRDRFAEAIAVLEPLHAWRQRHYGVAHSHPLAAARGLGTAYLRSGDVQRGVALLEANHRHERLTYPDPSTALMQSASALARAYVSAGRIDQARDAYADALAMARELYGERSAHVASAYAALGQLEFAQGEYARAAELHGLAFSIHEARGAARGAGALISLAGRADALRETGELALAESLQRKALDDYRATFGPDSPRVAARLANLARTELLRGRPHDSLATYAEAIALYRRIQASNPRESGAAIVGAWRSRALLAAGLEREALAQARAAVDEMQRLGEGDGRYHGEALAILTDVACRAGAPDCTGLRDASRRAAAVPDLARRPRTMLLQAAEGVLRLP